MKQQTILTAAITLLAGCGSDFADGDRYAMEALPLWGEYIHLQAALITLLADGAQGFGTSDGPSGFEAPERAAQQVLVHFPDCVAVEPLFPDPPRPVLLLNDEPVATGRDFTFSRCDGPFGIRDLRGTLRAWYDGANIEVSSQGDLETNGYRTQLEAMASSWKTSSAGPTEFLLDFADGTVHATGSTPSGSQLAWSGLGNSDRDLTADATTGELRWNFPRGSFEIDGQRWAAGKELWTVQQDGARAAMSSDYVRVGARCPAGGVIGAAAEAEEGREVAVIFDGSNTASGAFVHDDSFETMEVNLACTVE